MKSFFMFYDLLHDLFNVNEQIRSNAEKAIIQLRETKTDQYIEELIKIISSNSADLSDDQRLIHPKIQQASVVLLGQTITHPDYLKNSNIDPSFFEQLSTLLFPILDSDDFNLAHSSAILLGESLGVLICDKKHPEIIPNLTNAIRSSISTNNKNVHFLLISVISLIKYADLEIDQTILLFQFLFQIFQINELSNEVIQAITAMAKEIADAFNHITKLSTTIQINDEYNSFITTLMQFFNQLLQIIVIVEENKATCYNCFRKFFKYFSLSFFHENLDKVLKIAASDISTSTNESVLLSSIHFLKTALVRELKIGRISFFNFSHFDTFLMPLIRVFSMISDDDQQNLDFDLVEYETPHYTACDMIQKFVNAFPEHASNILAPLIVNLSTLSTSSEKFSFTYLGMVVEMNSNISIETSLFLLSLVSNYSTNLPTSDFVIPFIGSTLSSPSIRIRFASVRALKYYLSSKIIKSNDDSEAIEANKKLALILPELIKHVLGEHPIISRYSIRAISKFSFLPSYLNIFPCEIIFPLFLKVIETQNDILLIEDTFKYLEKIINDENREIKEVAALIEPVIQLLTASNQGNSNSFINENLRYLITQIVQKVTIGALPYYDTIYSLLLDHIEPQYLIYLASFSNIFANDYPQSFQNTFEIAVKFLIDSDNIVDDHILRNEVVFYCCYSLAILSKSEIFSINVQKTTSLLLNLLSKDNSNLNILIALSQFCLYHRDQMAEIMPTLLQIVSQININVLIEKNENEIDENIDFNDIASSCIQIITSCYEVASNDQGVISTVLNLLMSIQFFDKFSENVLQAIINLLLSLENDLFQEIENKTKVIVNLVKESKKFESLNELVSELDEKIKSPYAIDEYNSDYSYYYDE